MMKKSLLWLILSLLMLPLAGQYDERQILVQQANQLVMQRQYDRAEAAFLQILEKYPEDLNTVFQLIQMYFTISKDMELEEMLKKYQRVIPENMYQELRIRLLLNQGKLFDARSLADSYLEIYGSNQSKYQMIAAYFSQKADYDGALHIYETGRRRHGNQLFRMEIASASMQMGQYQRAMTEYLELSRDAQNSNLYIRNQVAAIVLKDISLLKMLRELASDSENTVVKELLASTLLALDRYQEALDVYKQMPIAYMRNFAADQMKLKNYAIARDAYRFLMQSSPQVQQSLSYGLELATIFHNSAQYDSSAAVIAELLGNPLWENASPTPKNSLLVRIRRLKADNDLALGYQLNQVRKWLQDTRENCVNHAEVQSLDIELARLAILDEDYDNAGYILARKGWGDMTPLRDYLQFLSHFMQAESTAADSLMNEFVLHHPGSDFANDIIYLNMLSIEMDSAQKRSFGSAIRDLQLYKIRGVDTLAALHEQTGDEELLILAIEWALGLGDVAKAQQLMQYDFKDELAGDYARLMSISVLQDREEMMHMAREYLKENPNSIFSPRFRQMIGRVSETQMSM
jgi:tetratricopeptide (TPR) repeat protein